MRKLAIYWTLVLGLCLTVADPNPDFGIPTWIRFVSYSSPNIASSAGGGATGKYNIDVALGSFTPSAYNGTTNLTDAGTALLQFTKNVTGTVNGLLAQIATYAADWYTPPSCIFSNLNSSLDAAFDFLNQSSALISRINATAGNTTANTLTAIITVMGSTLQTIQTNLDKISTGVFNIKASGSLSASYISSQIPTSAAVELSLALQQLATTSNAFGSMLTGSSFSDTLKTVTKQINNRISTGLTTINTALTGTLSAIGALLIDPIISENATQAAMSIISFVDDVASKSKDAQQNVTDILNSLFTGAENVTQNATAQISQTIENAVLNFSTSVVASSANAATCNTLYGPALFEMDAKTTTIIQACMTRETAPAYQLITILGDYMSMLEAQFTAYAARVAQCTSYGSASSPKSTKAAMNACFGNFVNTKNQTIADQTAQVLAVNLIMEFETVSQIHRIENCVNGGLNETIVQAQALTNSITTCLTTGSK
ncbi:hypothetical protein pipiens_010615 [Culex pipiens pipiens]|uniref:Uncharacterized protein n=1 Tax=Culex pipiens pipiens TaxID=38569 RepID=A0ABD1DCV4_CULPP